MAHGASTPAIAGPTLLETVADHEAELLAQVETAEQDARGLVEAAQTEAMTILQETNATLDALVADGRRTAAEERSAEVARIESETQQYVERLRTQAAGKVDALTHELTNRLLPGGGMGA